MECVASQIGGWFYNLIKLLARRAVLAVGAACVGLGKN
jgi:hypothetical protein